MNTRSGWATVLLWAGISLGAAAERGSEIVFEDRFTGRLGEGWSIEREEPTHWRVGPRGLEVRVQPGNMWGGANNAKNVFVRPIPVPTGSAVEISVTFSNRPTAQWEQANLVWYYDGGNMVKLGQELVTGRLSVVMGREEGDRARTVAIIPLDAYAVELRLQAINHQIRGQFRTAPWPDWRDVGECDLPVKGEPKASLHFYNGPPNEEHWVRAQQFSVRRLPADSVNWPRTRVREKVSRAGAETESLTVLPLEQSQILFSEASAVHGQAQAGFEQRIFENHDGSFGWRWERRSSTGQKPTAVGVGLGLDAMWPEAPKANFPPVDLAALKSFEVAVNAVTRLEDDHGDHSLALVLEIKPAGRVSIWFDWYGSPSAKGPLHDGYRDFELVPGTGVGQEIRYRITGFQGAPPRVNVKAFLEDAIGRGLPRESQLVGAWLGNQVWNGSRGGTLITELEWEINGQRFRSAGKVAAPGN